MTLPGYFWEGVFFAGAGWSLFKLALRYFQESGDPEAHNKGAWVEPPDVDQALHDGGMKPAEVAQLKPDQRRSAYEALEAARASGAEVIARCPRCNAPLGGSGTPLGYVTLCEQCHESLHIVVIDGRPHVSTTFRNTP